MQHRKVPQTERQSRPRHRQAHAGEGPHAADLYVGRQVAAVRVQSDITQAELARAVQISPQQLQKYENATNRVSASMLFDIRAFLGVPPPLPSWGLMIAEAKDYMFFSPWVIVIPGVALFVLVLGINLLGDGLRDLFGARTDP